MRSRALKRSVVITLALVAAAALVATAPVAATPAKICKPKTAKKCKKHVAPKPKPKPKPKPTPAPAPRPTPTPETTLTMGAGMPDPPASAITKGFEIAKQYLAKLGAPASWHAEVYAEPTFDAIVADAAKATGSDAFTRGQCASGCAFTLQKDKVFIYPFGSSYPRPDETAQQMKTPVHELWHTVQYALAPRSMDSKGADGLFLDGPTWLREGSADFVGYSALVDAGLEASPLRNNALYDTRNRFAGVTLESTASGQGNGAAYSLGFLAAELLVKDAGSIHALVDYWTKLGQGSPWPTAFQQVFGRPVEQFYAEFAAYRQSL